MEGIAVGCMVRACKGIRGAAAAAAVGVALAVSVLQHLQPIKVGAVVAVGLGQVRMHPV
jgi:hypothetical protein